MEEETEMETMVETRVGIVQRQAMIRATPRREVCRALVALYPMIV